MKHRRDWLLTTLASPLPTPLGIAQVSPTGPPAPISSLPSPRQLLDDVPARLGDQFPVQKIAAREASDTERRTAAAAWLSDVFSPLNETAYAPVLRAFGRDPKPPDVASLAALFPAGRPITSRTAEAVLVPGELPVQEEADRQYLHATGVLPFEVALTGEWARYVGSSHAGPPARDPLLRLSRAARLEGVARLAGIIVSLEGSGVPPAALGSGLLQADHERSGWPAAALADLVADPVARALLTTFSEDGLRWATVEYLSGRWRGLMASLERPGVGPEALFGARPSASSKPAAANECRLGPRGAMALLAATAEPEWLSQVVSDRSIGAESGAILQLEFDSVDAAARAADQIGGWTLPVSVHGVHVTIRSRAADSKPNGS